MVEQYYSPVWKTHYQVSQCIDYFNLEEDKYNQPIFVLDEDPKLCALALTTEHIKKYIELIVYTVINYRGTDYFIEKNNISSYPRIDYMFYNQRTANWFYDLYREMQNVYKKRFGKTYRVIEGFKPEWIGDLTRIQAPSNVTRRQYRGVRLPSEKSIFKKYENIFTNYKNVISKASNRISKFRVMYMVMGYLNSEFPSGAPAWYCCMKTTIWNSYNKMTRLYYRIDTTVDGKYSYYYSADNKNWIEIQNIPLEMRGLIDGIIFAREV